MSIARWVVTCQCSAHFLLRKPATQPPTVFPVWERPAVRRLRRAVFRCPGDPAENGESLNSYVVGKKHTRNMIREYAVIHETNSFAQAGWLRLSTSSRSIPTQYTESGNSVQTSVKCQNCTCEVSSSTSRKARDYFVCFGFGSVPNFSMCMWEGVCGGGGSWFLEKRTVQLILILECFLWTAAFDILFIRSPYYLATAVVLHCGQFPWTTTPTALDLLSFTP